MLGQTTVLVLVVVLGSALTGRRAERWLPSAVVPWVRTHTSGADRLRRALVRRSLGELTAGAADRGRMPDEVCVAVAPVDAARLTGVWAALETDLVSGIRAAGERRSWVVPPDVQVMLVEDPAVAPGHPVVHGRVRPRPAPEAVRRALGAEAHTATEPQPGVTRRTRRPGRLAPRGPVCELISLDGRGPDISLSGPAAVISVGRAGCDVTVRDDVVSARHAELRRAGSHWLVRDCGSTNGVEVNGRSVDGDVPLLHNDEVALGRGGPRYVFSRLVPDRTGGPGRRGA